MAVAPGITYPGEPTAKSAIQGLTQVMAGSVSRRGEGADDHSRTRRQASVAIPHQMAELAGNPVPGDRVAHGPAHDEADRGVGHVRVNVDGKGSVPAALPASYHGVELGAAAKSDRRGKHDDEWAGSMAEPESGRKLAAALTAAGGQDGPTGARPHAQPETVRAGTPAVVRLVGALAHGRTPGGEKASQVDDAGMSCGDRCP